MLQSFLANRPTLNASRTTDFSRNAGEGFQSLLSAATRMPECRQTGMEILEGEGQPVARVEPKIELMQENGQVRKIVVVCGCGDRIELECEF